MTHLLYGILKTPGGPMEAMAGRGGHPVTLISVSGLSAAVSTLASTEGLSGTAELMDYHRVVETLHFQRGVIPMRYGCCFDHAAGVERLLLERRSQYEALLAAISGKAEMGLSVLLPEGPPEDEAPAGPRPSVGVAQDRGQDYLQRRRRHYRALDASTRHCTATAEHYGRTFAGVSDRYKFETHKEKPLLSIYFLVPKGQVDPFRTIFAGLSGEERGRLMMSGPWPPYNFAC
jgi:hypothetical protein